MIIKGKSFNNTATSIMHSMLEQGGDLARQYAAKCLRMCAEEPTVRLGFLGLGFV